MFKIKLKPEKQNPYLVSEWEIPAEKVEKFLPHLSSAEIVLNAWDASGDKVYSAKTTSTTKQEGPLSSVTQNSVTCKRDDSDVNLSALSIDFREEIHTLLQLSEQRNTYHLAQMNLDGKGR